ncbi:PIN domain-like protein [Paraphoma chrysanthemicola]|uniref:PIN domain-like protein n=1 Tax=Paraphoma chrysanthemicola TaxID=798071 RepID=A0A8K0VWM0_9PLEO|nr:PIN domain-like protein [Paraphoma chrysanthemicola]
MVIEEHDRSIAIAQLAEEHHRRHGRALRIAVDEADWHFNNLTEAQVYAIRDSLASDQAFQGQEKSMFYRICRFLTLNIQLIFVFDGPGKPWKRGRHGSGKIDFRKRDLLKDVLRAFGIPYHEAPGEAEAECARMQALGMVDAQKGTKDRSKENTEKNKKTARVIDREALVLFAMLVGGDYDTKGLPGCGPSIAMKILKSGLGKSLCKCRSQVECNAWSQKLQKAFDTSGARSIQVPAGFPEFKPLQKYNNPKVTSDSVLKSNTRLNLDCARPIDELKLLETTRLRFNIWGRLCITERNSSLPREAKNIAGDANQHVFERKLRFSPFGVSSLRRSDFKGERLGYWDGNLTKPFDPEHRVECEIPNYWLSKLLPKDVLEPPPLELKRRRTKHNAPIETSEALGMSISKKRKRKECGITSAVAARPIGPPDTLPSTSTSVDQSYARMTPTQERRREVSKALTEQLIELSDSEEELRLPPSRIRTTFDPKPKINFVIVLGSPSSSEDGIDLLKVTGTTKQSWIATPLRK